MGELIECRGCTRHVRVEDARCPFCGRSSTTAAPSRVFAFVLPLMVMACAGGSEGDPKAKETPAKTDDAKAKDDAKGEAELEPEDGKTTPDPEVTPTPDQPDGPGDGGDEADPKPISDGREMATKYGGPPLVDGPIADEPETPTTKDDDEIEIRPAKKYGAPPRPAPKYGGPPRPRPMPKDPDGL